MNQSLDPITEVSQSSQAQQPPIHQSIPADQKSTSFWQMSNWKLWVLVVAPILIIVAFALLVVTRYDFNLSIKGQPTTQNNPPTPTEIVGVVRSTPVPTGLPSKLLKPLQLSSIQPRLLIYQGGDTYFVNDDGSNKQPTDLFQYNGMLGGSRQCLFYVKDFDVYRSAIDGSSNTLVVDFDPSLFNDNSQVQGATDPSSVLGQVGEGYRVAISAVDQTCSQAILAVTTNGSSSQYPKQAYFYLAPEKYEQPIEIGDFSIGDVRNFDMTGQVYFESSSQGFRYITKLNSRFNLERAFDSMLISDKWNSHVNQDGWMLDDQFNPQSSSSALLMYNLNNLENKKWVSSFGFASRLDPDLEALDPSITTLYWGNFPNASIQPNSQHVVYSADISNHTSKYGDNGEILFAFNTQTQNMIALQTAVDVFQKYQQPIWISQDSFAISVVDYNYLGSVYTCSVVSYTCRQVLSDASLPPHLHP